MNWLNMLPHHAQQTVLVSHDEQETTFTKAELNDEAIKLGELLATLKGHGIAYQVDNNPAWLVIDSVISELRQVAIPLPLFFSTQQVQHSLVSSGADILITSQVYNADNAQFIASIKICQRYELFIYQLQNVACVKYFDDTHKITFTSGSTGNPKGVCLSLASQLQVATSLHQKIAVEQPKHLCLLPLPVLLENVAGVYAPLLAGGCVHLMALEKLGFSGSQLANPEQLIAAIDQVQPNTLILVPELLSCLISFVKQGWQAPRSLKFIAVGGAVVSSEVIRLARKLGLPVYQGYGLSEAASVVSLNTHNDDLLISAGRVLPHLETRIDNGQLYIKGPLFLGYLGQSARDQNQWYATGDLVIKQQGRLHIKGRLKNQIITSFGRNISAEWPESLLLSHSDILQAVVIGESQPYLCALIYVNEDMNDDQLKQHIDTVNQQLPDYAKIKRWYRLNVALSYKAGLLTSNNKPKREAIHNKYNQQIARLYESNLSTEDLL
ncbi:MULTISPECIES: AMP-binding protein [Pseudoalteromonas]|uniref:Long-chain fatty acid--CoA ligase n=1 Tax=Pseudoalteromonas porphyrae TaxID=187330 RepID=A0A0N1EP52_9GAMM|nr:MULTISPECIES: AMP-binding protein [Pseudoalteromonas]KPH65573.1 long-chain fatty acid--CoA ligase [Pseudoalteromonas porphyrae]